MTTGWNLDAIAECLGVGYRETKSGVFAFVVVNQALGVRLKLEVAPEHQAVRVFADRDKRERPSFIGRIDGFGVKSVTVDPERHEVRFLANDGTPTELLVTAHATFRLVAGILPERVSDIPREAPEEPPPETVEFTGKLARPVYHRNARQPFFTAGLAVYPEEGVAPVWVALKAWGGVAQHAREIPRGTMVKATGRFKEEMHLDTNGEEQTRQVFYLRYIEKAS